MEVSSSSKHSRDYSSTVGATRHIAVKHQLLCVGAWRSAWLPRQQMPGQRPSFHGLDLSARRPAMPAAQRRNRQVPEAPRPAVPSLTIQVFCRRRGRAIHARLTGGLGRERSDVGQVPQDEALTMSLLGGAFGEVGSLSLIEPSAADPPDRVGSPPPYDCNQSRDGVREPTGFPGLVWECKDVGDFNWKWVLKPGAPTEPSSASLLHSSELRLYGASGTSVQSDMSTTRSTSQGIVTTPSGGPDYRPPGEIAAQSILHYWTGVSWIECRRSDFVFNDTYTDNFATAMNWNEVHPCGNGYYGTTGVAYVWSAVAARWRRRGSVVIFGPGISIVRARVSQPHQLQLRTAVLPRPCLQPSGATRPRLVPAPFHIGCDVSVLLAQSPQLRQPDRGDAMLSMHTTPGHGEAKVSVSFGYTT